MSKILIQFNLIIVINLLIFLGIWHILDLTLNTWPKYKIIFMILSIVSLTFISKFLFKKVLKNTNESNIKNNKKNNNESK